jgi:amidohydrolase
METCSTTREEQTTMSKVEEALTGLQETTSWQEELYKHLHAHPELSFEEVQTRAEIRRRLESFGFDVQEIGGGVVGVLANGAGRTVLFRADIDALPVTEATGLDYASTVTTTSADGTTVGVMHACGHDSHIAAALGAAELLSTNRRTWSGTYIALFQPAEELGKGAQAMVDDGLVEKVPKPAVCLAQHVLTAPAAGHIGTAAGPVFSAGDSLRITVHGRGSHGSMPHLGIDPVVIAGSIIVRLQSVVARVIAPDDFGVVTVGSIQAGTKANIIPDRAVLLVNVRSYDTAVREKIIAAIERIVRGECEAGDCPQEPEFDYFESYPLTDNDPAVTDQVTRAFVDHFGQDRVHPLARVPASEDFSIIPNAFGVPYTFWGNGGFLPGMRVVPNHNPGFAPAIQPTLQTATEAIVVAALAYLTTKG